MGKNIKKNNPLFIASISDIHFGAMDPDRLYNELVEMFLKPISESDLDLVMLCGDYWDKKLILTDRSAILGINFLTELIKVCKNKNIKIRLLKGTFTHDLNQLESFRSFIDYDTFNIINTVTEEEIKGNKILYVPEEYPENKEEFYKDYFNDEKKNYYDMIFGHGTIEFQAWQSQLIESEKPIKSAPVFNEEYLMQFSKGPIVYGHIHVATSYKNKIYYCGSFSRFAHNEEKEKGFLTIEYDNGKYSVDFQENTLAQKFIKLNFESFGKSNETFEDKLEALKCFINKIYDEVSAIKIEFLPDYATKNSLEYGIVRDTFIEKGKITFKIKTQKEKELTEGQKEKIKQSLNESSDNNEEEVKEKKYANAYKDPYSAIKTFINEKVKIDIDNDEIISLINTKV